jgi:YD repeat-containing protein
VVIRSRMVLFGLVLLLCLFCKETAAQTGSSCYVGFNYWFMSGPLPEGAICYSGLSFFFTPCIVPSGKCPPPSYCTKCNAESASGGHPINFANGNTYIEENDLRVPGLGGGLNLSRIWNSVWPTSQGAYQVGLFGPNWRSTYEERIIPGSGDATNYMEYAKSDGSYWYFGTIGGGTYSVSAPANQTAMLTQNGAQWTLTFLNGEQRIFSYASGLLTSIVDRNGNVTSLTYDGSSRLSTVTDPASRHIYFGYSGSSRLVTAVTTDIGLSLSYAYDGSGRLTQVTYPDLSTALFTYNAQSLITLACFIRER